MTARGLALGAVVVRPTGLEFRAAPSLAFDAARGEEAAFGVGYEYEEMSELRERFTLRFRVELDGVDLGWAAIEIRDTPARRDRATGLASREATMGREGLVRGRFWVEAEYARGPWGSPGARIGAELREAGAFTVRVR